LSNEAVTAQQIILRYREMAVHKLHKAVHRPSPTRPDDLHTAREYLSWCRQHSVDPLLLMDMLSATVGPNRLPWFSRMRQDKFIVPAQYKQASDAAAARTTEPFVQAVRELKLFQRGHEQVRGRYVSEGRQALCLTNTFSGGYDPRSEFCPRCPHADACRQQLHKKFGFDVSALRAGQLHQVPEEVRKALRGWDGGLSV
jgi:hypothetical protein